MSVQKLFNPSSKIFRQRAILVFLWLVIAVGLFAVRSVLLPFMLASLIAYVFHPVVGYLERLKFNKHSIPRIAAVLLIYFAISLFLLLIFTLFLPQFYGELIRLAKEATSVLNSIDDNTILEMGREIEEFFRTYQLPFEVILPESSSKITKSPWISIDILAIYQNITNYIFSYISSESKSIVFSAQHIAKQLVSFVFMLFLVLMITAFLLIDLERIKNFAFSMVPSTERQKFADFLHRLDQRLSGVVRGQLTICLINALLTLLGLLILKIKFAFTLATLAGIFSLVPIFGSIASTIPIVFVALTISPLTALLALIWIVGIHAIEANMLNPKIMGDSAKIHPVLIIMSLLVGEKYYGIIGALLAVPIMSIITTIFASLLGKAKQMDEALAKPVEDDRIGA